MSRWWQTFKSNAMNEDDRASKYASNNLKTQEQIKDSIKYFVKKL